MRYPYAIYEYEAFLQNGNNDMYYPYKKTPIRDVKFPNYEIVGLQMYVTKHATLFSPYENIENMYQFRVNLPMRSNDINNN